jgi:hypothetical protein
MKTIELSLRSEVYISIFDSVFDDVKYKRAMFLSKVLADAEKLNTLDTESIAFLKMLRIVRKLIRIVENSNWEQGRVYLTSVI